jgi:hypothetical protein
MRREGLQARGIYKEVPRPSRGLALAATKRSLTVLYQNPIIPLGGAKLEVNNKEEKEVVSVAIYLP